MLIRPLGSPVSLSRTPPRRLHNAHNVDITATNFSATFNGSTAFSYLLGEDSNEDRDYDIAVGGYWTIMINWGRRDAQRFTTGETPQASLICLKANNIENGSEGAAMRPLVDAVLVLFTSFFTTAWLMR